MSKVIVIGKENASRLLLPWFPDLQLDNSRLTQDQVFDIMYKYKVIGRARLEYRLPFALEKMRDSQTYMVYGRPLTWVRRQFHDIIGDEMNPQTQVVYVLFRWLERDLVAFEEIFKSTWEDVIQENPAQHQMQLGI